MTQDQQNRFKKAVSLYKQNHFQEALNSFRQLLSEGVKHRDLYFRTGLTHLKKEEYEEAADILRSGHNHFPDDDGILYHLALALARAGETEKAIGFLKHIANTPNTSSDTLHLLATLYLSAGMYEQALPCFISLTTLLPKNIDVLYNLGFTYHRLKQFEQAEQVYQQVITLQPENLLALNNLGLVHYNHKKYADAARLFQQLLNIFPDYPNAWYNLGNVYRVTDETEKAIEAYEKAIEQQPVFPEALNNLAQVFYEEGKPEQAEKVSSLLIHQQPTEPEWLYNYGILLTELGRDSEATAYYVNALALDSTYYLAAYALAEYYLMNKQWKTGWDYYERRLSFPRYKGSEFTIPKSPHQIQKGDTVLIVEEQGFGDTFQFIRFVSLIAELEAKVYFVGRKSIFPLINSVDGISGCFEQSDIADKQFTWKIPLCSLMSLFAISAKNQITSSGYINWRAKSSISKEKNKVNIGIYWRGNPVPKSNRKRHARLEDFLPVIRQKNIRVFSLQVDPTDTEKELLKAFGVTDLSSQLTTFVETASALNALDLLISIDSGIVHLAGAMNKPVYILLSSIPDWRWHKEEITSSWYPSAHLFRQKVYRLWNEPMQQIAKQLETVVTETVFRNSTDALYLALTKGDNFGWGICSKYLRNEISTFRPVTVLEKKEADLTSVEGTVLHALTGADLAPLQNVRGTKNIGYTFFENELNNISVRNAASLDLILAGSSWCERKMNQAGIYNTGLLIQGVDPDLFHPLSYKEPSSLFVIFSGGKFELRKGQDLVLRAFKLFSEKHPDAVLMTAWYNLWPQTMLSMQHSPHILCSFKNGTYEEILGNILHENEIDQSRVILLGLTENNKMREVYAKTDIGIFPNRCEGGTNLVLMEYMACAKPAIVSANSGHTDVATTENCFLLEDQKPYLMYDDNGVLISDWKESSIEEILRQLEAAYSNRQLLKEVGIKAGESMKHFTWNESAKTALRYMLHH